MAKNNKWPEKVANWPLYFEKWPRSTPVIARVSGLLATLATFFGLFI